MHRHLVLIKCSGCTTIALMGNMSFLDVHLTFERHKFELRGCAYGWIFFFFDTVL